MSRHHITIRAREEAQEARLGKTFCQGWGPDAPEMSGANAAALEGAQIAREQWTDYRDKFAPVILDQMQQQVDVGRDSYNLAREQQDFQLGLARKYDDRFWSVQAPLEDQIVGEARRYDTEAERERMAGTARGDVEQAFAGARSGLRRDMGRMGLNPSDPKYFAMTRNLASDQALATANAMNKVREAAKQMGWAKRMDAAALGRNLPGFSGGSSQLALGWGGQGSDAAGAGLRGAVAGAGAGSQAAATSGNIFQSTSQNLRANAIESAKDPGFDTMMGLAAGGLRLAGTVYGAKV